MRLAAAWIVTAVVCIWLTPAGGARADDGAAEHWAELRQEVEADVLLDQAKEYDRRGTPRELRECAILLREVLVRYPNTPQAGEAHEMMGPVLNEIRKEKLRREDGDLALSPPITPSARDGFDSPGVPDELSIPGIPEMEDMERELFKNPLKAPGEAAPWNRNPGLWQEPFPLYPDEKGILRPPGFDREAYLNFNRC